MTTARPWAASSAMNSCTAALEPMSMPLVGSSRMMTRGLVASHLAMTTFCWLPPESSADVLVERGGAQVEAARVLAGEAELLGEAQEAAARGAGERGQGDVLEDRQAADRALAAAVLGDVDDAVRDRVGGARGSGRRGRRS